MARNVAAIISILILAGAAGVGYSYTQLSGKITDVSYSGLTWAQPSAGVLLELTADVLTGNYIGVALTLVTGIDLNLQLSISNGGMLAVSIPSETHDLVVNGINLGGGSSSVSQTVNAGATITIPVEQTINTQSLSALAQSIIASGGNLDVQINGQAHYSILGLTMNIPFQQSSQISLVQELEQHVEELVSGQNSQQQSNQYNGNPSSSGSSIVNGVYDVSPGHYYPIPFTLTSAATITGSFSATATLGNNIIVYILDQSNYALYENGQSASTLYNSGQVASGNINLQLGAGTYYIVLDNTYSTISTKDVTIQVSTG